MPNKVDDPQEIDAFFAVLGNSLPSAAESRESQEEVSNDIKVEDGNVIVYAGPGNIATSDMLPAVDSSMPSTVASPAHDSRVIPTIPASGCVVAIEENFHFPSVDETQPEVMTQGIKNSGLKLKTSMSLLKQSALTEKEDQSNLQLRFSPNKLDFEPTPPRMTSVQIELLSRLGRSSAGHDNYHDSVIAQFKAKAEAAECSGATEVVPVEVEDEGAPLRLEDEIMEEIDAPCHDDHPINESSFFLQENTMDSEVTQSYPGKDMASSSVLTISPATSPLAAPVVTAEFASSSSQGNPVIKEEVDESNVPKLQVPDTNGLEQATLVLASKIAKVTVDQEEKETHDIGHAGGQSEAEDRENARVFTCWGTPAKRDKAASQIRKIILSQLPAKTDFTLIQSLIHGGSIENMIISPNGTTAQVTFTTGKACDDYYDKGKDVDVISGMLEGYLSAGATRVVQATEADEDWSMRALSKIAEGKKGQRKVESIVDSFRDGLRTIIFRFTSIADAVNFRSTLLRDPDWEYSNIQFVADPCEKATDVHLY